MANLVKSTLNAMHHAIAQKEHEQMTRKAQSFELLRLQEEINRFHSSQSLQEESEGRMVAKKFLPFDKPSKVVDRGIKTLIEKCANDWSVIRNDTRLEFPWPSVETSVQDTTTSLLTNLKINESRSYLMGYFESVCRVPEHSQTNQGKLVIALILSMETVKSHILTVQSLKEIVCEFIGMSKQCWSLIWSDCVAATPAVSELFEECIQHCLFVSCPFLPLVLYQAPPARPVAALSSSASSAGNSIFRRTGQRQSHSVSDDHHTATPATSTFSSSADSNIKTILNLQPLMQLCGVSEKYFEYPVYNAQSRRAVLMSDAQLPSEELAWLTMMENPFLSVGQHIDLILHARTPAEAATVGLAVVTSVVSVARSVVVEETLNLAADELIPLLTFSFALYFRTPVGRLNDASQGIVYRDPTPILSMMQFADSFLPRHLSLREEGYALTVCTTALLTLPN